jgi:tRNA(Ile)-lysidine synthase
MSPERTCRSSPDASERLGVSGVLLAQVRRTIYERSLIPRGARVLCACSGGPDSAALLFALARLAPELGFELEAASVDHGLRETAALDVAIASRQAARFSVTFHPLRVWVGAGASVQAHAREARYAALLELAARRGATRVAVGHTRDDQAETVLMRLIRGAGLHGLGAIDPCRDDGVVRPLIDCDRTEVHRLARAEFTEIADDASNSDSRFERVRVRAHVMPALVAQNPRIAEHLAALADEARASRIPFQAAGIALLDEVEDGDDGLCRSVLAERPAFHRRSTLRAWLERRGITPISRAHVDALDHALRSGRGHIWLPQGWSVRVEGDRLLLLHGSRSKGQADEP